MQYCPKLIRLESTQRRDELLTELASHVARYRLALTQRHAIKLENRKLTERRL